MLKAFLLNWNSKEPNQQFHVFKFRILKVLRKSKYLPLDYILGEVKATWFLLYTETMSAYSRHPIT